MKVKRYKNGVMTLKLEESDILNKDLWDGQGLSSELGVDKIYNMLFPIYGLRVLKDPDRDNFVIIDDTDKCISYTRYDSSEWLKKALLLTYKGKVLRLSVATGWKVSNLYR